MSLLCTERAVFHTVAQLLGHKDLRIAARYQHLSPAFLADAVAKLETAYQLTDFVGSSSPDAPNESTGI